MGKKLIDRWENEWLNEGNIIRESLLNDEETEFVKLDLRGFKISKSVNLAPYIKGKKFSETDFSYADFSRCRFEKCRFEKCRFEKCTFCYTNLINIIEQECEFVDCDFYKGRIKGFIGEWGSLYKGVIFEGVNLNGLLMHYPDFQDSEFKNCNLKKADFGGAVIENVKFKGVVTDTWFRGKYRISGVVPPPQINYKRLSKVNPMNADFSEAIISYTLFTNGCDLSNVIMPNDGNHYLINNIKKVKEFTDRFCANLSDEEKDFFSIIQDVFLFQREGEKVKILNRIDWYNSMTKSENLRKKAFII